MDDLVSRDWLLKHLFFEVDKELVLKAPNAEKRVRYRRISRKTEMREFYINHDGIINLSVQTKVCDDMEAFQQ